MLINSSGDASEGGGSYVPVRLLGMVRGGIGGSLNDNKNNNEQENGGSHGGSTEQHLARAVYHFAPLPTPAGGPNTLRGVLRHLDRNDIVLLAKDGLGRPVRSLDGILEQRPPPSQQGWDAVSGAARTERLAKLAERWVTLSVDRVGHHCVIKLFGGLVDMDDRLRLVKELVATGIKRLTGNAMGRKVMEACFVGACLPKPG